MHSAHRRTPVQLYLAHPSGLESTADLPIVLHLHGRGGMRPTPIPYDSLAALERLHREGAIPPFGFAPDPGFSPGAGGFN